MFGITEQAASAIKKSIAQSNAQGLSLRVAARQNEDKTFEYAIGFDEPGEADIRLHEHGVNLIIAPAHLDLLEETLMDFGELEAGQLGFIFLNPLDANYSPPAPNA